MLGEVALDARAAFALAMALRASMPAKVCPTLGGMTPEPSDETLMMAYARGDAASFEVLYRRHRGTVYAFLMRSLGRRDQADDCFQDVWSRVITARIGYRVEARFTTWLLQIAHNLLIDRYRRQKPDVPLDVLPESSLHLADDAPGPEVGLSEFERHKQLRDAIAALPAEQRHAVLLRLDQELSLEEIATITGVGRETVKSRLRYAMDKLRESLS